MYPPTKMTKYLHDFVTPPSDVPLNEGDQVHYLIPASVLALFYFKSLEGIVCLIQTLRYKTAASFYHTCIERTLPCATL